MKTEVRDVEAVIAGHRNLVEIRDLLQQMLDAGHTRSSIRTALETMLADATTSEDEVVEDRIRDALDIIEGWVGPHMRLKDAMPAGLLDLEADEESRIDFTAYERAYVDAIDRVTELTDRISAATRGHTDVVTRMTDELKAAQGRGRKQQYATVLRTSKALAAESDQLAETMQQLVGESEAAWQTAISFAHGLIRAAKVEGRDLGSFREQLARTERALREGEEANAEFRDAVRQTRRVPGVVKDLAAAVLPLERQLQRASDQAARRQTDVAELLQAIEA